MKKGALACFEPRRGQAPASWRFVHKPHHQGGQALPGPTRRRPNATTSAAASNRILHQAPCVCGVPSDAPPPAQRFCGKSVAATSARGNDRRVADDREPWPFEGMLVEHRSYGRGRLFAEPGGGLCRFIPAESGPIIAFPADMAASEVRILSLDEMSDDELEELDWEAATWTPLAQTHADVANEIAGLLVDEFLRVGGLDRAWRDEALAQLQLDVGRTPNGVQLLRLILPIAAGESRYEWDGDATAARRIAIGAAEAAGRTITVERQRGAPCGWEPVGPDT